MTTFIRMTVTQKQRQILSTVIPIDGPGDLEAGVARELANYRLHNPGAEPIQGECLISLDVEIPSAQAFDPAPHGVQTQVGEPRSGKK